MRDLHTGLQDYGLIVGKSAGIPTIPTTVSVVLLFLRFPESNEDSRLESSLLSGRRRTSRTADAVIGIVVLLRERVRV